MEITRPARPFNARILALTRQVNAALSPSNDPPIPMQRAVIVSLASRFRYTPASAIQKEAFPLSVISRYFDANQSLESNSATCIGEPVRFFEHTGTAECCESAKRI
jgi:hypothetical protein